MRVCEKDFPLKEGEKSRRKPGFYLDPTLKQQLDYYIKNISKDWDFVIIVSGEGEVRVGKSVLALQIAAYYCSEIERIYGEKCPFDIDENIVFTGYNLIKKGNNLGVKYKYPVLIFDEAGADLESSKVMRYTTQAVKDFLRECGQYNMLTILVLPEFFDLPKGIALSRSDCLLNVYYLADEEGYFQRGYFKFFSKPMKKYLYLNGKKNLDYNAGYTASRRNYDFFGTFPNFYPFNEDKYRKAKYKALKAREKMTNKELRMKTFLKGAFQYMIDCGLSYKEVAHEINQRSALKMSYVYVHRMLEKTKLYDEDDDML